MVTQGFNSHIATFTGRIRITYYAGTGKYTR